MSAARTGAAGGVGAARWAAIAALARALLVALLLLAAPGRVAAQEGTAAGDGAFAYPVEDLGPWLASESTAERLRTPNAALERFLAAGDAERYEDAARVLNLADLEPSERRERGPELARRLHFVMVRRVEIDWRSLPDRPDGANDLPRLLAADGDAAGGAPAPRRNLLVGLVEGAGRDVEIRLERVDPPDLPPVWLVARSTVDEIDALYERYGPGRLERLVPEWALASYGGAPVWQWVAFLVLVGLSIGVGVLLQRLAARFMRGSERRWMRGLASEVARPFALLAATLVLWLATSTLLTLSGPLTRFFVTALPIVVIVALTWLGMNTINFSSEYVGKRHVDSVAERDEVRARRDLTYLSVARRAFVFVVLLLGLGVLLAQFSALRSLGASLLASAGVAGIVLGIAAQGSLANVMAGVQIALTQLVRIGDTVYFDGEWSYVEDITYTFVILRTWDQRRIAVPNKHVIANPLENWEMTSSHLVMPVVLLVDYRTPLDELRRRYQEVLEAAEEWDREAGPNLQVTGVEEDVMSVRVLCSAKDATSAWNLHCRLREELLAFLRDLEGGRYLPRRRVRIEGDRLAVDGD